MFSQFIRNQTYTIFLFLYIPFAIHGNFRNCHQLFYNRSGSYKIRALPIFIFLVYRFHGNIDYLKKHIQPNFIIFPKTVVIFTSITLREGKSHNRTIMALGEGWYANRLFYSCVVSYLAMNASEAGGDLALIQTFKLFSCKCKLVSTENNLICTIKAERSVSKQGQLQPRCQSEARSHCQQL